MTMPVPSIRIDQAQPDDAVVLARMVGELLGEISAAVGSRQFDFQEQETAARAREWLAEEKYWVFLAWERHDRMPECVCGFIALTEIHALYAGGAFGTIPELFVYPAHRSSGVGSALLARAKQWGRSRRWARLEVTTPPLPQFDRTVLFYERQGFSLSGGRKLKLVL
ncbi:MAG: N-acetyltransferase family protein [Nitrospiraceae bacterium]